MKNDMHIQQTANLETYKEIIKNCSRRLKLWHGYMCLPKDDANRINISTAHVFMRNEIKLIRKTKAIILTIISQNN